MPAIAGAGMVVVDIGSVGAVAVDRSAVETAEGVAVVAVGSVEPAFADAAEFVFVVIVVIVVRGVAAVAVAVGAVVSGVIGGARKVAFPSAVACRFPLVATFATVLAAAALAAALSAAADLSAAAILIFLLLLLVLLTLLRCIFMFLREVLRLFERVLLRYVLMLIGLYWLVQIMQIGVL
jgi:hypothetical protein